MGSVLAIVGLQLVGLTALLTLRRRRRRQACAPTDADLAAYEPDVARWIAEQRARNATLKASSR